MKSMFWWDYTSEEIGKMAPETIVFQPVAAVEQHGPHLPVGTDSFICSAFADRLRARFEETNFPGLFLPLMAYGKSNEHTIYPGTITYSVQTFMSVLMDIGRSCARAGFKKFVFINGHGGNQEVLDVICRELRIETGMQVYALHPLIRMSPDLSGVLTADEAKIGIHAGRVETSVIMNIRPELVRREKMDKDYSVDFKDCKYLDYSNKISFGWMTNDVSKSGAIGDPAGSNPEEAEGWMKEVTDMLYDACLDIRSFELL